MENSRWKSCNIEKLLRALYVQIKNYIKKKRKKKKKDRGTRRSGGCESVSKKRVENENFSKKNRSRTL